MISPLASAYIWQYIFDYDGALNRLLGASGSTLEQAVARRPALGALDDPRRDGLAVHRPRDDHLPGRAAGIPDELDEAAAVDGAATWFRFRRITLPLLAPAMTVSATLTLIFGLRVFDQVLALTGGGPVDATETLATQVCKQTFALGGSATARRSRSCSAALVMVLAARPAGRPAPAGEDRLMGLFRYTWRTFARELGSSRAGLRVLHCRSTS